MYIPTYKDYLWVPKYIFLEVTIITDCKHANRYVHTHNDFIVRTFPTCLKATKAITMVYQALWTLGCSKKGLRTLSCFRCDNFICCVQRKYIGHVNIPYQDAIHTKFRDSWRRIPHQSWFRKKQNDVLSPKASTSFKGHFLQGTLTKR